MPVVKLQSPVSVTGWFFVLLLFFFFQRGWHFRGITEAISRFYEMYVGMILNEGVGSLRHISFQYAKGERLVSEWFHSAGEKHFLNLKRLQILQQVFRLHEALNSTQSSGKRDLHFPYAGFGAFAFSWRFAFRRFFFFFFLFRSHLRHWF